MPLAAAPEFLILDDPTSGLDVPTRQDFLRDVIRELAVSGIGILITDHNVRDTLAIVDRGYIINAGAIFRTGSPVTLSEDPEVRRVYLGDRFRLD